MLFMFKRHQEQFQVACACSAQNPKMLPNRKDNSKKNISKAWIEQAPR